MTILSIPYIYIINIYIYIKRNSDVKGAKDQAACISKRRKQAEERGTLSRCHEFDFRTDPRNG